MLDMKWVLKSIAVVLLLCLLAFPVRLVAQEKEETPQEKGEATQEKGESEQVNGEETTEKTELQKKMDRLFQMSFEDLLNVRISTAGKTSQLIADTPASVVLITRDDIETYGYRTLAEILENVPGLFAIDDYEENGISFGVRGFWSGVANDNMMFLVNGVHQVKDIHSNYTLNKILIPVEAIDRIEIIRGPMSVIYGNGAFYGVINIITNEDVRKPVSLVSASLGSEQTSKMALRVSGNLGGFRYFLNSSLFDTNGPNYPLLDMVQSPSVLELLNVPVDSTTKKRRENNEKYFNFSGTFKGFFVDVSYNENKKEFYFAFPSVANGSQDVITSTNLSFGYKRFFSDKVEMEGKLSYVTTRDSYKYDHLRPNFYGIQVMESSAWEGEVNLFYTPSSKFDLTSGIYNRTILKASNMFNLPSFGVPRLENNYSYLKDGDTIDTRAIFTQLNYNPIKNLRLIVGARLEQSPKYGLGKIQVSGANPYVETTDVYDKDKIEFIPRVAALYYLNDKNVFKFLYGKAINRPSFYKNTQNTLAKKTDPIIHDLDPESIETLELNYMSMISSRFTFNLSFFRNTLNRLITRVVIFDENMNYRTYSDNAGKMNTNGIELTLNAEPIEYFRVELSGTYQKTEDKGLNTPKTLAYSPKFLGYFKASYLGVGFKVAVTGNYVGAMEAYWDETRLNALGELGDRIGAGVKGYFVLGANLRFDDLFVDGLFLNVKCSNILDAEIRYPTSTNNDWAYRGTLGLSRTIMVSLGYKF